VVTIYKTIFEFKKLVNFSQAHFLRTLRKHNET
jgi:hypothetical protein